MASKRDREILNAIVNPLLPVGEGIFDDEEKVPLELKDEGEIDTKEYRLVLLCEWHSHVPHSACQSLPI